MGRVASALQKADGKTNPSITTHSIDRKVSITNASKIQSRKKRIQKTYTTYSG